MLLRKNEISDLREINYLTNCPNLQVLWLAENPIAAIPNYRMYVLKVLPNLRKLDEVEVTPEEVDVAASMSFDDDDLGVSDSKPQRFDAPPTQPASEDFEQNDGYNYDSPKKSPSYEMNEPNIAASHQPVQRSPPMPNYEDNKQPSYSPMNEMPQAQHQPQHQPQNPGSKPVYWSKGPTGGEMYGEGGKFPSYEIPQRPQTGNPYSREAPPLRYGMNDTGNYFPPMQQPRLMHAHSTPLNAGPAKPGPNGGKYKNENIL